VAPEAIEEQVVQSAVLKPEAEIPPSEPADSYPVSDSVTAFEGVASSSPDISRFETDEANQEPLPGNGVNMGTVNAETASSQPTEVDSARLTADVVIAVQKDSDVDAMNVGRTADDGENFSDAPEIKESSSDDVRSAETDDAEPSTEKPTDDELSISARQDQKIELSGDSELTIPLPRDQTVENGGGDEILTSTLSQDQKIEHGDDDGLFFTDARSEVSEYDMDVDADRRQSAETKNTSAVDVQIGEDENSQSKSTADVHEGTGAGGSYVDSSSIPHAVLPSAVKPKSK
jgi:hypothetical protein